MRYQFDVKEITKSEALTMVQKYHYSNTLPKLNKVFLGFFLEGSLVGVITLGYGTRPRHTIQKLFPALNTEDYLEIGRMCMTEEMPRNSESQMLSACVKWIKVHLPKLKILFTWADGMLGKCGYVYQASNFIYAGYSKTDIYLMDGVKIHPRQCKKLFGRANETRIGVRPTVEQMKAYGIKHYAGHQYRYFLMLCNRREQKSLWGGYCLPRHIKNPKDSDLWWSVYDTETRKWKECGMPPYRTDSTADHLKELMSEDKQLSLF